MQKIIIGIHGLGNKPEADLLQAWWLKSIHAGLARIGIGMKHIPFELVFWADILHPELLDPKVSDTENPLYLSEPYTDDYSSPDDTSKTMRAKLFGYFDKQLDRIFLNEDQSINLKGVTDRIIHRYFSDLESYFSTDIVSKANPDFSVREHIQLRLIEVLKHYAGYDIMVIGHSMGSLVAYDVLFDNSHELIINTFATIGSPLGLPFITGMELEKQRQRNPNLSHPLVPECIQKAWVNFSDIEDQVSMDHAINDDFDANKSKVLIKDFSIYNDYEVNSERNPHKSFGYLRTPEFARLVDQFLTSKTEEPWFNRAKKGVATLLGKIRDVWNHSIKESKSNK